MNDRESFTFAARAAGTTIYKIIDADEEIDYPFRCYVRYKDQIVEWRPRDDDGDALRLAVKLNAHILRFDSMTTVRSIGGHFGIDERDDGDACAATRLAVFRFAVKIGQLMEPA